MPKKRHLNKYSKPQSTAPALLSSTAARRNDGHHGASPGFLAAPTRLPSCAQPLSRVLVLWRVGTSSRVFLRR